MLNEVAMSQIDSIKKTLPQEESGAKSGGHKPLLMR